jgi:23S rRNA (cytosine1962-C5)-methyltransferase
VKTIRVNRRAANRVVSGHPWIFSSDVTHRGTAQGGEAVMVLDSKGHALGTAHYSSTSQICLRLLSTVPEPVDISFYERRLSAAASHRRLVVEDSGCYRLVHAEGDLLPGLIIDRYADYFVIQTLDQGMERDKPLILEAINRLFSPQGIVERNDSAVRDRESLPRQSGVVSGDVPAKVSVIINGFHLQADLLAGQKTGVYLDQRENYLAARRYAHGAALDCFTSTGGFALHAASACTSVEAVDSSAAALETAKANAAANGISNIEFREANVFDLLASYAAVGRSFSTVILDPPAFAKSRSSLDAAGRGYKEINLRALRLLPPGGILVTCSCSHHFSEAALLEVLAEASLDAGKQLRVLERRTQSRDHPILLTVPETHYLKCLILQVL